MRRWMDFFHRLSDGKASGLIKTMILGAKRIEELHNGLKPERRMMNDEPLPSHHSKSLSLRSLRSLRLHRYAKRCGRVWR
jgi:hypothetical protein